MKEKARGRGGPAGKEFGDPPDGSDEFGAMLREARAQLGRVQLELDVHQATVEQLKTGTGVEAEVLPWLLGGEISAAAPNPRWYRDERIKSNLGYRSLVEYRRELGLAA